MTTIDIGGNSASAEMSANAMALGADNNLVFQLKTNTSTNSGAFFVDAVACVNRPFRFNKNDVLQKAKMALTHLPSTTTSDLTAAVSVMRDTTEVAAIPFRVPASGQMQPPTITTNLSVNASSTLAKSVTALKRIVAAFKDPAGSTTVSNASLSWLGEGSSVGPKPVFNLGWTAVGEDLGNGPGITLTIVPYDKLADKESAPFDINLSWPMGPFPGETTGNSIASINDATGTLPQGTIINFMRVKRAPDGTFVRNGGIQNFTIGAAGGLTFNPTSSGDGWEIIENATSKARARFGYAVFYKLSTQSTWTNAGGTNQNQIIANSFPEGGLAMPPTSFTFDVVTSAELMLLGYRLPNEMLGAGLNLRFEFKGFILGRQVFGTGAVRNGNTVGTWNSWVSTSGSNAPGFAYDFNNAGTSLDGVDFSFESAYPNLHVDYEARSPRGDQYYVAGQRVNINVNVPAKPAATGLLVYVQNLTTNNGVTANENTATAPWSLIYDGPAVTQFSWNGAVISSPTPPAVTNTTQVYPATTVGSPGWPVADPEFIEVSEGDSVICKFTSSLTVPVQMIGQITVPVEFL